MSDVSFDWVRWLTDLNRETSGVSKEVIDSWTRWMRDQREPGGGPDLGSWKDALPTSIAALSMLIERLQTWSTAATGTKADDEVEQLRRRIELLERELARLKARMSADLNGQGDAEHPGS